MAEGAAEVIAMATALRGVHTQGISWGRGFVAGIGAGLVAALVTVVLGFAMRIKILPPISIAGSAFVAGVLGGLLYAGLSRVTSRPATALCIVALLVATIDSLVIIFLPFASGVRPPKPIFGLVEPLAQIMALVGFGRLGQGHFPPAYLAADATLHYATAVVVYLVVPWLAKPQCGVGGRMGVAK